MDVFNGDRQITVTTVWRTGTRGSSWPHGCFQRWQTNNSDYCLKNRDTGILMDVFNGDRQITVTTVWRTGTRGSSWPHGCFQWWQTNNSHLQHCLKDMDKGILTDFFLMVTEKWSPTTTVTIVWRTETKEFWWLCSMVTEKWSSTASADHCLKNKDNGILWVFFSGDREAME